MDMAQLQLLKSYNVLEKQGGKLCSITDFIPLQTVTALVSHSFRFWKYSNLPHCAAARDGKNIKVMKPTDSSSLYCNYIYFYLFLLQVWFKLPVLLH